MSHKATEWAWSLELPHAEKIVLLRLADRSNPKHGHTCYPSLSGLARDTGLSRRSIVSVIAVLVNKGLIERKSGNRTDANVYSVLVGREIASLQSVINRKEENRNITVMAAVGPLDAPAVKKYPSDFEELWKEYPKRSGDNPKPRALKAWNARKREGVEPQAIIDGVRRYAAFVRATGKEFTEYVKQAATFIGPDRAFEASWDVKTTSSKPTDDELAKAQAEWDRKAEENERRRAAE